MKYLVKNSEVLELIKEWRQSKNQNTQLKIIKSMEPMIKNKIVKFSGWEIYRDLLQEGRLGVIMALQDFDYNINSNFFFYSNYHIRNRIRIGIKENIKPETPSFISYSGSYDRTEMMMEHVEKIEIVFKYLDQFPPAHREMVCLKYGVYDKPHSFQEIGDMFSLSRQRVHQITSKIIKKANKNKQIKNILQCEV